MTSTVDFLKVLFNGKHKNDYIEIGIFQNGIPIKQVFYQNIDEIGKYENDKRTIYYKILTKHKETTKGDALSQMFFIPLDIDFHSDGISKEELELKKENAIKKILSVDILSKPTFIVDSGRGLHIYYKLKTPLSANKYTAFYINLLEYVLTIDDKVYNLIDQSAKQTNKYLRLPNTFNEKANKYCEVIYEDKDSVIDDYFLSILKNSIIKNNDGMSVSSAMKLCGLNPDDFPSNKAVPCPFPKHNDNKPSFAYYSDSDTFWCFVCSSKTKNKKYNGIHFLELMGRQDLIEKLQNSTANISPLKRDYILSGGGQIYKRTKNGVKFEIDFTTNKKILMRHYLYGTKFYADCGIYAIRLDDYPDLKKLKQRYNDRGLTLHNECSAGSIPKMIDIFKELSQTSKKYIVFNRGINYVEETETGKSKVFFYMNNKVYPSKYFKDHIIGFDEILNVATQRPKNMDINNFIEALIDDGNYPHIMGFLWGVATTARDIIISKAGMFPILVATGKSGTGKSYFAKIIKSMFGLNESTTLNTTDFSLIKKLEDYGTLPVHFEEYGNKQNEIRNLEVLKDIATDIYIRRERGTASQNLNFYYIQSPYIITGEKNITDPGIINRCLIINLAKIKRVKVNKKTNTYKEKFLNKVNTQTDAFKRWTKYLYGGLLYFMDNFLDNYWYKFRQYMNDIELSPDRDIVKFEIILYTLQFLEQNGLIKEELIDIDNLINVIKDTQYYKRTINQDMYEEIIRDTADIFEIGIAENSAYMKNVIYSFGFSNEGVIVIRKKDFLSFLMLRLKRLGKNYSQNEILASILNSSDFIDIRPGSESPKKIKFKDGRTASIREMLFLSPSEINKDLFSELLAYKLYIVEKIGGDGDQIRHIAEEMYDEIINIYRKNENIRFTITGYIKDTKQIELL